MFGVRCGLAGAAGSCFGDTCCSVIQHQLELGLTVYPSFALNGGQDLEKVLVYFCRYVVNGKRVVLSTVSTQPGLHSCHSLPNVTIIPHASMIVSPTKCG